MKNGTRLFLLIMVSCINTLATDNKSTLAKFLDTADRKNGHKSIAGKIKGNSDLQSTGFSLTVLPHIISLPYNGIKNLKKRRVNILIMNKKYFLALKKPRVFGA